MITFSKAQTKKKYYHKKKKKISKNSGKKDKIITPMIDFGSSEWRDNELIHIF